MTTHSGNQQYKRPRSWVKTIMALLIPALILFAIGYMLLDNNDGTPRSPVSTEDTKQTRNRLQTAGSEQATETMPRSESSVRGINQLPKGVARRSEEALRVYLSFPNKEFSQNDQLKRLQPLVSHSCYQSIRKMWSGGIEIPTLTREVTEVILNSFFELDSGNMIQITADVGLKESSPSMPQSYVETIASVQLTKSGKEWEITSLSDDSLGD